MNRILVLPVIALFLLGTGCATQTHRYYEGETRQTVAGFSEEDIEYTAQKALANVLSADRIRLLEGVQRAVMIVENIAVDTMSRGRDAGALAESIGQTLREELTNSGKVIVYNKEAAQYAKIKVEPQYRLAGRLSERNLRQDNGDYQKEYNLNLTLVDLATGLEFWQKRVHVGKEVARRNLMN